MKGDISDRQFTVAIVDNDPCASTMMVSSIRHAFPGVRVLWRSERAQTALEHIRYDAKQPDVIVMDMVLNAIDGIEICRRIRRLRPHIGIICVTAYPVNRYEDQAATIGAQGIFSKRDIITPQFHEALEAAARGETLRRPPFHSVHESFNGNAISTDKQQSPLSQREIDVLHRYARGFDTNEIAHDLRISAGTVFSHVHHATVKLNVGNRKEAIRACIEQHLW